MKDHFAYLKYVLRHKWHVLKASKDVGLPLWQAIIHDWTKFLPSEWFPYVHYFYKSNGSRQARGDRTTWVNVNFDDAWNKHQKRNKHHWQYWVLTQDSGGTKCLPMPYEYVKEMVADWVGASIAISGKNMVDEWYSIKKHNMKLHIRTRASVEGFLRSYHTANVVSMSDAK